MYSTVKFLLEAAHHAPSADNSQPWHFDLSNGNLLSVSYDAGRVGNKTFAPDNPATLLTMGAVLENLHQAGEAAAVALEWKIPTALDLDQPIFFETRISNPAQTISSRTDSLPLFKRHTNRLPFLSTPLSSDLINLVRSMNLGNARLVVFEKKAEIKAIARLVRLASEVRFQTQEIHEWLGKSLRFDKEAESLRDGLDIATLHLPPGGKFFMKFIQDWRRMRFLNLFGAYKMMSYIDSTPIAKAPALVAVISPSNYKDFLDAGRLMQRLWIHLNTHDIAVQPYFVIPDQLHRLKAGKVPEPLAPRIAKIQDELRPLFALKNGEQIQMLFRVGYSNKTAIRAKRLTIEKVCSRSLINEYFDESTKHSD